MAKKAASVKIGNILRYLMKPALLCVIIGALVYQQIQIKHLENTIEKTKYVYVYDVEDVLRGLNLDELNREFEAKISILNNEVTTAQDKISALKDSKVKDDFSDVYLKSLKLKRDTMVNEYSRTLQNITNEINDKVTELAQENGATIIFDKRLVTASTSFVVDLTPEIVSRVKLLRPRILDE